MFKKLKFLFKEPRSVQEIFDVVIGEGFYTKHSYWMCPSLRSAFVEGVISRKEMVKARREIEIYLGPHYTLESRLYFHDLPCKFSDRLAIYRDWANRPSFEGKHWG